MSQMQKELIEAYKTTDISAVMALPLPQVSTEDRFEFSFIGGPKVSIVGPSQKEYTTRFINKDTQAVIYESIIKPGHWSKASREYFINWRIDVLYNNALVVSCDLNLKNKKVFIQFGSSALGDTIAWMPYLEDFQKKHQCLLIVSTFHNNLFNKCYPQIEFVSPGTTIENLTANYNIGVYYDLNKAPVDSRTIPLQHLAAVILGLPLESKQAQINEITAGKPMEEKYVCIAPHSTAQAKYWNNSTGWQEVIDYLNTSGYKVVNLSREPNGYMGNKALLDTINVKDLTLEQLLPYIKHAECLIGISSGLSWLAWAMGQKTIMISGFTESWYEFQNNCIRIDNSEKCKGCFNDKDIMFDKGDWNWCPRHKDTSRQFECSKTIEAQQVIDAFKNLPKLDLQHSIQDKNEFNLLWNEVWTKEEYSFEDCKVQKGDTVIDVGANIGLFSLFAFKAGASIVYSIEPNKENFKALQNNVKDAKHFNIGLSNKSMTTDLYIDSVSGGHTILKPRDGHPTHTGRTEQVNVLSLKDFLIENAIVHVDFLKIDTEGSELDILQDIYILAPKIKKIALEFHHTVHSDSDFSSFVASLKKAYQRVQVIKGKYESNIFAWEPFQIEKIVILNNPVFVIGCPSLGDTLSSTATLRKLASIYEKPLDVFTYVPELFKNNPDVSKLFNLHGYDHTTLNVKLNKYSPKLVHTSFINIDKPFFPGVVLQHNLIDIRQYHAAFLGFDLLPEDRTCIYIPDKDSNISLPNKYVVVHPAETWESRTWSKENWQKLVDQLYANNISVVVVGKDTAEFLASSNSMVAKPVFALNIYDGMDYSNKLSISETWHILNKASVVVTMDSGILHLAGTTDTYIIQLGSSIDPKFRAPYRHGNQKYKYSYVPGTCNLFCGSCMKYGLAEHGTIQGTPVISNCLENKSMFECHPSVKNVVNEIKKVYI